FQGRQGILNKMSDYFDQDTGDQHIFLLHGLGGAGKTQIALKFIKQTSNQFSDIFLIDTSTQDTIDTGLKNIAVTKNAGTNQQDSLRWLSNTPAQWLLFFDNADDPKIDLNQYFPKCSHGNILITSRNPGLCVYAGAHSLVSDMEESDAIVLLLTSA
ncbi:P-loop containing nucleoside triphosphate hydrolase protein, partial [Mycena galericulata]